MHPRRFTRSNLFRAVLAIALLLAFAFWNPGANGFFRGVFHTMFLPIERILSAAAYGIRDTAELFMSIGDLNRENERLLGENATLRSENASLTALRSENEELRRTAGLDPRLKPELVAGSVVARGDEYGTALLDRGSGDGVREGAPVLSSSGALVGTVDETYPASSRIRLVTSSESVVGGITAENGTKGVVKGDRGLGVVFSMAARSEALAIGDRIVTSGSGGLIPSGLFVGTVASVQETEDRLFRESTVALPDPIERLRFLFVIRDTEDL